MEPRLRRVYELFHGVIVGIRSCLSFVSRDFDLMIFSYNEQHRSWNVEIR